LTADRGDRLRRILPADLREAQTANHVGDVVPAWRRDPQRAGRRLRQLREAAGFSQLALQAASGLSHEAISLLESGHRTPQAASVRRLAQALGIDPEGFVATEEPTARLTTAEAAARLGVPVSRLQAWLAAGVLPGVKVSGQWRLTVTDVAALDGSERLRGRSRRLDPRYHG
jgi:excisionase family DNA binding protein